MKTKIANFLKISQELYLLFSDNDSLQRHCIKIGRMECGLIQYLYRVRKPVCMNDLAEQLCVSHSRITRIVDNLVKKGLVKRYPSMEDRRKWFTEITDDGLATAKRAEDENNDLQKQIIESIPDDEVDTIVESLQKYIQAFRATIEAKEEMTNG